jgi:preprotein translocase subunit YajC
VQSSVWTAIVLFAQNGEGAAPAGGGGGLGISFLPIIIIFVLFWLLLIRPQRREQRQREEMLKQVKPTDRVITGGGLYGVVTAVDRDEGSVVVRIDDANNTKVKVALWAIARVLTNEPPGTSNR